MKTALFIMIVGLPGSGKTTLANSMAGEYHNCLILDDLSLDFIGGTKKFNDGNFDTVIITDPLMCGINESTIKGTIMKNFKCDEYIFDFHYFENDPEACTINATNDPKPNGGTLNFIKHRSKTYKIPEKSKVYKVYRHATDA